MRERQREKEREREREREREPENNHIASLDFDVFGLINL